MIAKYGYQQLLIYSYLFYCRINWDNIYSQYISCATGDCPDNKNQIDKSETRSHASDVKFVNKFAATTWNMQASA